MVDHNSSKHLVVQTLLGRPVPRGTETGTQLVLTEPRN
jgi:hypothetical protein